MNKQELIDKLKKQLTTPSVIKGSDFDCGHGNLLKRWKNETLSSRRV